MNYSKFFCIGIVLFSAFSEAETLIDIYNLALKNDNELKAAHSQYFIDKQGKDIAFSRLLPQISLEATYGISEFTLEEDSANPFYFGRNENSATDTSGYSLKITQPLFDLTSYRLYQSAKLKSTRANMELKNKEQKLILKVANLYLQLLKAKADYKALLSTEEAFLKQLKLVESKYSLGLSRIAEVNEARSSYDSAVAFSILAKNNIDIRLESLKVITGVQQIGSSQSLPEKFIATPPAINIKNVLELTKNNNLEVKISEYRVKEAKKEFAAQSDKHLPTVSARINYSDISEHNTFNYARPYNTQQEQWSSTIMLNIPIYSGGSTSALSKQAKYGYLLQKDLLNQKKQEVIQLTNSSYLDLISGESSLRAREIAVRSSETSLESFKLEYETGSGELRDVLTAERELFREKQNYYDALITYFIAGLKLKEVAGVISIKDLFDLNQKLASK